MDHPVGTRVPAPGPHRPRSRKQPHLEHLPHLGAPLRVLPTRPWGGTPGKSPRAGPKGLSRHQRRSADGQGLCRPHCRSLCSLRAPPRAVYGLRTESPPHGLWIQGPERGGDWPGSLLGNGLTGRSTDWARPTHFEMGTSGPVQTGRHDGGGLSSPRMGVQPRIHTGAGDPLGWRVLTVLRGGWATSGLGRCPAPPPAWSRAPPGPGPSRPCSLGYQFSSVFLAIFSTVGKDWTQDLV